MIICVLESVMKGRWIQVLSYKKGMWLYIPINSWAVKMKLSKFFWNVISADRMSRSGCQKKVWYA